MLLIPYFTSCSKDTANLQLLCSQSAAWFSGDQFSSALLSTSTFKFNSMAEGLRSEN